LEKRGKPSELRGEFCNTVFGLLDRSSAEKPNIFRRMVVAGGLEKQGGMIKYNKFNMIVRCRQPVCSGVCSNFPPNKVISDCRRATMVCRSVTGHSARLGAADITNRYEYACDWSRAIDLAKIAVAEAQFRSDESKARRMAQKVLKLAAHLPADQRRKEVEFVRGEYGLPA